MHLLRVAYICPARATAITALLAARYWCLSSRPTPTMNEPPVASIDDVPSQDHLGTQVDVETIHEALAEASQRNKHAAAAACGAALLGIPS